MANYYTLFSFAIPDLTDTERAWITHLLSQEDGLYEFADDPEDEVVGFELELQDDESVWVHSDESGTPSDVAAFLQEFLRRYRPTESIGFEWANTCSRPILDSYGGGACFVTADEVRWNGSGHWLAEQQRP